MLSFNGQPQSELSPHAEMPLALPLPQPGIYRLIAPDEECTIGNSLAVGYIGGVLRRLGSGPRWLNLGELTDSHAGDTLITSTEQVIDPLQSTAKELNHQGNPKDPENLTAEGLLFSIIKHHTRTGVRKEGFPELGGNAVFMDSEGQLVAGMLVTHYGERRGRGAVLERLRGGRHQLSRRNSSGELPEEDRRLLELLQPWSPEKILERATWLTHVMVAERSPNSSQLHIALGTNIVKRLPHRNTKPGPEPTSNQGVVTPMAPLFYATSIQRAV
jgi:hypothetical protein